MCVAERSTKSSSLLGTTLHSGNISSMTSGLPTSYGLVECGQRALSTCSFFRRSGPRRSRGVFRLLARTEGLPPLKSVKRPRDNADGHHVLLIVLPDRVDHLIDPRFRDGPRVRLQVTSEMRCTKMFAAEVAGQPVGCHWSFAGRTRFVHQVVAVDRRAAAAGLGIASEDGLQVAQRCDSSRASNHAGTLFSG